MTRWLLLALLLAACPTPSGSGSDDDDVTANDDDATADDDDVTPVDIACEDAAVEEAMKTLAVWPRTAACASAWFAVGTQDQAFRLGFTWAIQAEPIAEGNTWALYFDGIEPGDAVLGSQGMTRGSDLMAQDCGAAGGSTPMITESWTMTEGSARITVTNDLPGSDWEGTVALAGVSMTKDASTETCQVPDVAWPNIRFGWSP